jgi:hypothetical protein
MISPAAYAYRSTIRLETKILSRFLIRRVLLFNKPTVEVLHLRGCPLLPGLQSRQRLAGHPARLPVRSQLQQPVIELRM